MISVICAGSSLPAAGIARELDRQIAGHGIAVVTAPPGAGKSTLLPLTIMEGLRDGGKVLMLEPRRIAARQIAERMSSMLDEKCGQTIGYRVRFESRVSDRTRIEVLTEGILTRMLTDDPTLDGVSAVIFDEFHERSLQSDLALALVREARALVRPDLKIIIMSATIDAEQICKALDAPLVCSEGRSFPVRVEHTEELQPDGDCALAVAQQIRRAHASEQGDILAFLPGEAEIRRCAELLQTALEGTEICPLYGMLPFEEQRRAIAPSSDGRRKVVLATPIAETSLTIEGVRIVVDSGLCRRLIYDPRNGLSHLATVRISRDMADQRTGRAGRVAPGVCYRMWSLGTESRMDACRRPEIEDADLSQMALDIAAWGEGSAESLQWLTPPPQYRLKTATQLLQMLGALDAQGRITAHGRSMASLPCHPRISSMLVKAEDLESKALACDIAAILEERDPMPDRGSDLSIRIKGLRVAREDRRLGREWSRMAQIAAQYRRLVHAEEMNDSPDPYRVGALIAAAYPERIAKARSEGNGAFILASGDNARVDREDVMASFGWIAVATLNASREKKGKIFLCAPLDPEDVTGLARERDNISWDSRSGSVVSRHESAIGCLVLSSRQIHNVPKELTDAVLCEAARKDGLSMFDISEEVQQLQRRIATVALWHPELDIPDLGTEALMQDARRWLPLYAGKATNTPELRRIDMCAVVWGLLSYEQQQAVERLAPSHITVPTGSRIRIDYRLGAEAPVLKVRLQECFGLLDTPTVDGGKRAVLMELLSPGFKPVQLTSDLRSFWQDTYFEVRKELRRRYPRHSWPDNPVDAEAVRGVRRK